MIVRDPFALGMKQVVKYWMFLLKYGAREDAEQEVRLAAIQFPPSDNLKAFELALNRGLYSLARSLGFRKRGYLEGRSDLGYWWERTTVHFDEIERFM